MLVDPSEEDSAMKASKSEIRFRQRAVRNMWIIILTICFVDTYSTLYSIVLYIWSDE